MKVADKPVLERRCICAFCLFVAALAATVAAVAALHAADFVLVAMLTDCELLMKLS